jgi:hypothetical protein
MFVSNFFNNKPSTTNQKPKTQNKKTKKTWFLKLNENKQKEKYLLKNASFWFSTLDHSQFLQEGMSGVKYKFFLMNNNTSTVATQRGK